MYFQVPTMPWKAHISILFYFSYLIHTKNALRHFKKFALPKKPIIPDGLLNIQFLPFNIIFYSPENQKIFKIFKKSKLFKILKTGNITKE